MTLAEWLEKMRVWNYPPHVPAEVLAEIEGLRAENERLRLEWQGMKDELLLTREKTARKVARAEAVIAVAAEVADGAALMTALRRALADWQENQGD